MTKENLLEAAEIAAEIFNKLRLVEDGSTNNIKKELFLLTLLEVVDPVKPGAFSFLSSTATAMEAEDVH